MASQPFEIGLVGAGAISAGAYTAGVIDFMVYALDLWYAAKADDDTVPPHDVKLSVFSGASAGAMTAALATAYMGSDQPPITNEADAGKHKGENKLFDSWVDRIDASALLGNRDLEDAKVNVVSLLDSTVLAEIAEDGVDIAPRTTRRPYLAENFEVLLTVTNLRGVPYAFGVQSSQVTDYDMSLHADYVHFRINDSGDDGRPDRYTMSWSEFADSASPCKQKLCRAALASGAFPIGLAPRELSHVIPGGGAPDWYSSRLWPLPTPEGSDSTQCVTYAPIPVNWGGLPADYRYDFECVDGGVMNNEPLELARRALAGAKNRNDRQGALADRAVLLIDPFPNDTPFNPVYEAEPGLLKTALALFGALKNQARFKPDELVLAAQDDVYSRFMIAPSRDGERYPIACGALGGFGGFLKRDFRAHDYFLGRRNAQKFLRDHFVLPEDNPLFADWSETMRETYCVQGDDGQPQREDGQRLLPIIPLVGEARDRECPATPWPQYTQADLDQLLGRVDGRARIVLARLVNQYFGRNHWFVRMVARIVIGRKRQDILAFAEKTVKADLTKMGLMR